MNLRSIALGSIISAGLIAGGYSLAQPSRDVSVSPTRHPNLNAAQSLTVQAFDKVVAAQNANEWDTQGHALKAKQLLDQANSELKLATATAGKP